MTSGTLLGVISDRLLSVLRLALDEPRRIQQELGSSLAFQGAERKLIHCMCSQVENVGSLDEAVTCKLA